MEKLLIAIPAVTLIAAIVFGFSASAYEKNSVDRLQLSIISAFGAGIGISFMCFKAYFVQRYRPAHWKNDTWHDAKQTQKLRAQHGKNAEKGAHFFRAVSCYVIYMIKLRQHEYKTFFIDHVVVPYQNRILKREGRAQFTPQLFDQIPEFLKNEKWEEHTMTRIKQIFSSIDANAFPPCKATTLLLASMHHFGINVVYT